MLVLRNCKLVGELTEGTDLTLADIVIEGKNIADIVPCGTTVEGKHEEYDVKGATVLPGLINAHLHLFANNNSPFISVPTRAFNCMNFANYLLKNGYTTLRDCGEDDHYPVVALRNQINAGNIVGPNIQTSGPTILPTEPGCEGAEWFCLFADTPMEYRKAGREVFKNGADFIKIYGSGSMLAPGSVPGNRIMEEDEVIEAVKVAKMRESYVSIHAHGDEIIGIAVKNGVRVIDHATFISEETLKLMDGREDVGLCLTLSLFYPYLQMPEMPAKYKYIYDKAVECLGNAYHNHNVLIGWGTDIDMKTQQNEVGAEFRLRKEMLGCSNIDLLKQATINSAKLICMDDKVGSIKAGKMADLVIIDGDPVEDISLMYGAPAAVIKSGAFVK